MWGLLSDLDVDEDAVVGLVQNFVSFGAQRELEGDLRLPCWDLSCFGHLDVTADQLDGLWIHDRCGCTASQRYIFTVLHIRGEVLSKKDR